MNYYKANILVITNQVKKLNFASKPALVVQHNHKEFLPAKETTNLGFIATTSLPYCTVLSL